MVLGKWIFEKVNELEESIERGIDKDVDAFIDKEYFRLMQISCIYVKVDKRHRLLSLLQWTFYVTALFYHYVLLFRSTLLTVDLNMVLFCQSTHFTLLCQLTTILVVWLQTKHQQIKHFHKMLSLKFYDYKEPPTEGEDTVRSMMKRQFRLLSIIPICVALAAGAVLVLSPIIDKKVGSFDFETMSKTFSTHLPYPYGIYPHQTKEGFGLYVALGGQLVIGILLTFIIGTGGFIFLNMSHNVSLQLHLLQNSLHHIESRAEVMYKRLFSKSKRDGISIYDDQHFSYCYSKCLRKNFEHHQVILRAFRYLEEVISIPMFLAYMTGTIVIALSLISAGSADELPGTTIASMVLCGVEIGYMFLFSVIGQRLSDQNMDLRFEIYNIKWYLCNKGVKYNLLIFQEVALQPLTMMAGGIVPANMETFATVMNSAYSYYNLVSAFGN